MRKVSVVITAFAHVTHMVEVSDEVSTDQEGGLVVTATEIKAGKG